MFWAMENEKPGFAKAKVASMSALGPLAYLGKVSSPIRHIATFNRGLDLVGFIDIYFIIIFVMK